MIRCWFSIIAVDVTKKRGSCSKVMHNSKTVEIRSPNYGVDGYGNNVSILFSHLILKRFIGLKCYFKLFTIIMAKMNDIFRNFASMKLEFQLNWIDITEYVSVCVGLKQSHAAITFKFFNLELKRKNGQETEKTVTMHLMVQVQCRMFNYIKY